jgi:hypothetical protein
MIVRDLMDEKDSVEMLRKDCFTKNGKNNQMVKGFKEKSV